eukprot:163524-Chlamydomonas_euryale.AAC.2
MDGRAMTCTRCRRRRCCWSTCSWCGRPSGCGWTHGWCIHPHPDGAIHASIQPRWASCADQRVLTACCCTVAIWASAQLNSLNCALQLRLQCGTT